MKGREERARAIVQQGKLPAREREKTDKLRRRSHVSNFGINIRDWVTIGEVSLLPTISPWVFCADVSSSADRIFQVADPGRWDIRALDSIVPERGLAVG